ncbi:GNAT family N-acetyltransferase [Clostridium estertheticum]|nr:GNAT family N-acetyltransferase [Clostridium estertheticum]
MVKNMFSKSEVYVYEEKNVIWGFIGVDNGYIVRLFVSNSQQSRGIGKKLIEKCKKLYTRRI